MNIPDSKLLITVLAFCSLLGSHPVNAEDWKQASTNLFHGFDLAGKIINPKCVELLQTYLSESTNIIIRSVVLEECQDSNLAFEGKEYAVDENGNVGFGEGHDSFSYRVLGRLENGDYLLFHEGNIGRYEIRKQKIDFDFQRKESSQRQVLTKISSSFIPCFIGVRIEGNDILISKHKYEPNNPRANQCLQQTEELKVSFANSNE